MDGPEVILYLVVAVLAQLHRGRRFFCPFAISQERLVGWPVLLFQDQQVVAWCRFLTRKEIRVVALRQDLETLHRNGPIVLREKLVREGFGINLVGGSFQSLVGASSVLIFGGPKCLSWLLKEQAATLLLRLHHILDYNISLY